MPAIEEKKPTPVILFSLYDKSMLRLELLLLLLLLPPIVFLTGFRMREPKYDMRGWPLKVGRNARLNSKYDLMGQR